HVALDDPDLALAAGAVAAAGGVDRDAVPAGGVEQRDARRHPHLAGPTAVDLVGDADPVGAHAGCFLARCAAIHAAPHSSLPSSRSAAFTASTICGVRTSMTALVSPHVMAIGRNAAPSACRCSMPNETMDAASVVTTPNSSRI